MKSSGSQSSQRRPFGLVDVAAILAGVVALALLLVLWLIPTVAGYTPYVILSGSMAPALNRGDLLFVTEVEPVTLRPGDLVAVRTQSGGVVTHRVYECSADTGAIRTKADQSDRLDAVPVTEDNLVGRAVYKIPLVGHISIWLGGTEAAQ